MKPTALKSFPPSLFLLKLIEIHDGQFYFTFRDREHCGTITKAWRGRKWQWLVHHNDKGYLLAHGKALNFALALDAAFCAEAKLRQEKAPR